MGTPELSRNEPPIVNSRSTDFAALYQSELQEQVARATFLLASNETAADVVHDVFAEVYERWDSIDNPGAYLQQSVLNRCRDAKRRTRTRTRFLAQKRALSEKSDLEYLTDALAKLPFNQRAAVVLRFYAGLTEAEIADVLDCALGSVGPWTHRALAALRKEFS